MTNTEYLIVGQGISGTFLSWYLLKAGASIRVIDQFNPTSSSQVAAGIINPVTGRRIVKTWMIDTLLPFARASYEEFGKEFGVELISCKNIIDFFPSAQMRLAFSDRVAGDEDYLRLHADDHRFHDFFEYDFGSGEIAPAYVVQMQTLINTWRNHLRANNLLIEDRFRFDSLAIDEHGVSYQDIRCRVVIFCDGVASADSPLFGNLPFALNKGEALIIRANALPADFIYKKAVSLVPLGDDYFWAGSSHEWNFTDALPSKGFLEKTKRQLENWLKIPFVVEKHVAAIRPATLERRPFVGIHPQVPQAGIFNGMGTKGCSLAPYFAKQFADYLTKNSSILPEVNVNRFSRVLSSTKINSRK